MLNNWITYKDITDELDNITNLKTVAQIQSAINSSFNRCVNDLKDRRGVIAARVMASFPLIQNITITDTYESTSITPSIYDYNKWCKRLVIDKIKCELTGTWTLILEGTNGNNTVWQEVTSLVITNDKAINSVAFNRNFDKYRFRIETDQELPLGEDEVANTINLQTNILLVENSFDEAILLLSKITIYESLINSKDDAFSSLCDRYGAKYDAELEDLTYYIDPDSNDIPDGEDGNFQQVEISL